MKKIYLVLSLLSYSSATFSQLDPDWLRDRIEMISYDGLYWEDGEGFLNYIKGKGIKDLNYKRLNKTESVISEGNIIQGLRFCRPKKFQEAYMDILIPKATKGDLGTYIYMKPSDNIGITDPYVLSLDEYQNYMLMFFYTLLSKSIKEDPDFFTIVSIENIDLHPTNPNNNPRELMVQGYIRIKYLKVIEWDCEFKGV